MTERSLRRHFEVHHLRARPMRAAATKLGGSINDAFVTGLASALGRYHERLGSDVDELRLAMPISTRQRGDRETNSFVPARVCSCRSSPRTMSPTSSTRCTTARGREAETAFERGRRDSPALVAGLPTSMLVAMTRSQTRTIDFAASNCAGSPVPLYLAGARIIANFPFGPRTAIAR